MARTYIQVRIAQDMYTDLDTIARSLNMDTAELIRVWLAGSLALRTVNTAHWQDVLTHWHATARRTDRSST